ncbi:MAG: MFS transporter [Acidobacteriota bacterium]
MLGVLKNRTYRHLFLAQVVALLGTGLATVALGLLAFDLVGDRAGAVLGSIYAMKMVAYVGFAPLAAAVGSRFDRKRMLVLLDLVRAGVAVLLPFVTEVWQIYALLFVLYLASAAFTPTFQASIPEVLPKDDDYTNALSLSRLAHDLESLLSPALAAALLLAFDSSTLFLATTVGFVASALLVVSVALPSPRAQKRRSFAEETTRGLRIYLATPRLRGLFAVNLAVASAGAMVIVNTVVLVQGDLGLGERSTAIALAVFGAGSMLAALVLPRALSVLPDRPIMLTSVVLMFVGLLFGAWADSFGLLLVLWLVLGVGYSAAQTPSGRLLKRSAHSEDRPALFAAQFALSHSCWLVAYPLAGFLGSTWGLDRTFLVLAGLAALALVIALRLWPASEHEEVWHVHPELDASHPHWEDGEPSTDCAHRHAFVIDDLHPRWPAAP